jgi:hypothetical protein
LYPICPICLIRLIPTKNTKSIPKICIPQKKSLSSTNSPLFSTGAPSNVTVASCRPHAKDVVNSTNSPLFQQGPLRMLRSRPADHLRDMGVFLPVLRTPFNVRLYAAFMRAYATYRRP